MRFNLKFTPEAEKGFLNLPKGIKETVRKAIYERLETNPLAYGKPLRYSWKGYRSLRVSKYRIIYKVEEEKIIVIIFKVDIRKDVYKN